MLPPPGLRYSFGATGEAWVRFAVSDKGWSNLDVHDAPDQPSPEGETWTCVDTGTNLGLLVQTNAHDGSACAIYVTDQHNRVAMLTPADGIPTPHEAYLILDARGGLDIDVTPWWYD